MKDLRVVFFGTPEFAVPVLRALAAQYPVVAVVTVRDKPIGRHQVLTPCPVKVAAGALGIPVIPPAQLPAYRPDVCVVAAYGKLIADSLLAVPRLGFMNIHPSLLPEYRGPSPVRSAILEGLTETGVSLMLLDAEMDHGPLLAQERWTIPAEFDAPACEAELFRQGAALLLRTLSDYVAGTLSAQPQNHAHATLTHKFTRTDGRLDWTQPARHLYNRIRALSDNPGTWTLWGGKTLNIFRAHPVTGPAGSPGMVALSDGHLTVACGTDALVIEELQPAGGKRQPAHNFLNGHRDILGSSLT